jgi:hypothetical protein
LGFGWRMSSWPSPADFLIQFVYMFFIITWKFCSKFWARVSGRLVQPNSNYIPCCVSVGGIGSHLIVMPTCGRCSVTCFNYVLTIDYFLNVSNNLRDSDVMQLQFICESTKASHCAWSTQHSHCCTQAVSGDPQVVIKALHFIMDDLWLLFFSEGFLKLK